MDAPSHQTNETGRRLLSGGRLLALVTVVCVVCLVVMVYVLANPEEKTERFVPPPFESSAVSGTPDVPENMGYKELDAETYQFSVCGFFAPENGKVDVWFTNPAANTVWLKVRVLDTDGETLGETGLLRPGEYVRSVALDPVPSPGAAVQMKVMAYEPDTYYSAGSVSLNTTVEGGDTP